MSVLIRSNCSAYGHRSDVPVIPEPGVFCHDETRPALIGSVTPLNTTGILPRADLATAWLTGVVMETMASTFDCTRLCATAGARLTSPSMLFQMIRMFLPSS